MSIALNLFPRLIHKSEIPQCILTHKKTQCCLTSRTTWLWMWNAHPFRLSTVYLPRPDGLPSPSLHVFICRIHFHAFACRGHWEWRRGRGQSGANNWLKQLLLYAIHLHWPPQNTHAHTCFRSWPYKAITVKGKGKADAIVSLLFSQQKSADE